MTEAELYDWTIDSIIALIVFKPIPNCDLFKMKTSGLFYDQETYSFHCVLFII